MPEPAFTATPKQMEFLNAVRSGLYRFIAIGGGIRGTKTWAVLAVFILLCRMFPRSRWVVVRKDLPTLRRNTIPSFNKLRELTGGFLGPVNQSTWTSTATNGSEIIFFPESLAQDPDLERWRGLEANGFALEEANELEERSANKAIERAGSWIIQPSPEERRVGYRPRQPPILVLFTFNPTAKWPRRWFYEPWKLGKLRPPYIFIPSTAADNPYITEGQRESWKSLPPEEYKQFVLGEWDFADDPKQLIKYEWVMAAKNVDPVTGPTKLGYDVARYGDDYTSLALIRGNALVSLERIKHMSLDKQAEYLITNYLGRPELFLAPENVHIDLGMGAGIVDILHTRKLEVRGIDAGGKAVIRFFKKDGSWTTDPRLGEPSFFRFRNVRSQMWWEFREKLRLGKFSLAVPEGRELPDKLLSDLLAPQYEITADRVIEVQSKEDIKKLIGRSTDDGDALVQAAYELPPVPRRAVLAPSLSMTTFGM